MDESIETIEYKGYYIKIYPDDCMESPRQWDNLGILLTYHPHYDFNMGKNDKNIRDEFDCEYQTKQEIEQSIIKAYNPVVIAPIYLYDHSGLRLKIGNFNNCGLLQGHAEFDTSHIGYILATKEQVKKEWQVKRIGKKLKEQVKRNLEAEIDAMDKYVSGQVYGYVIENNKSENLGSCWGFYEYDYMIEEAKNSIDCHIEEERKSKQNKLKTLIKNHVNLIKRQELLTV